jgi:S-formylglutathione hydrolase FrmB
VRKPEGSGGVSRRGFVLGGLGIAIAAIGGTGVAATQTRTRRVLHAAGLLDVDDHPAPPRRAMVEYRTLESERMGRRVNYAVAHPPTTPEAVVYCLHGRGADEGFAVRSIRFQDFLVAAGVPAVVVAPDGGPSTYWHPRRSGLDPLAMLVGELIPTMDAELGPVRRGILGWSMGGYGALLAAERNPDLFSAVALGSPALWRRFEQSAPGAFDDELDFRAHDVFTATDRVAGLPVRADIGRDDPFLPGFHDLERFLPEADTEVGKGFHDSAFWRSVAPAQARFFGQHLVGA